jgi:hypothetical protein
VKGGEEIIIIIIIIINCINSWEAQLYAVPSVEYSSKMDCHVVQNWFSPLS